MTLKINALLVLVGLCAGALGNAVNLTCTKEIVESYGVISHDQAKKERLVMCPHIQFSCCPAYEQFKMFKTYNDIIKPSFILLNEVLKKSLDLLEKAVTDLMAGGTIDQKIQGIADKAVQLRIQFAWNKIKNKRPKAIFEKLRKYQKTASSYVAAWKSAFYCTICDFASQNFIDLPNKKITFSAASCDALVQNTILYSNLLNTVLIPLLSTITEIVTRLRGSTKYQKLHNMRQVNKAIGDCVADYKQYDSGLGNCKAYCEFFNPAQDNYVFEGYPEFFANTLVEIRLFSGGGSGSSSAPAAGSGSAPTKPPSSRKLIEDSVRDLIRKTRNRRLNQKLDDNYYFEAKVPKGSKFRQFNRRRVLEETDEFMQLEQIQNQHFKLENRRVLAEGSQDWSQDLLDPNNNVTQIIDIFDSESADPEFDDAMVNQMMQVQDIFNTGDPAMYAQMIRKYYVDNFSSDLDDIDSDNLFKETTTNRTDLSTFKTLFSFAGIDIHRIVNKMNWSLAFKQIGVSLTSTSNDESEMIFPDVVQALNSIANRDVKDFYRNQHIRFRRPHFGLFNETMSGLLKNFAIAKIRHIISENMAVYNYLVKSVNQENADKVWGQIEDMRRQLRGLTLNSANYTVALFNQTVNNETVQSLNITGPVNMAGFANVTTIEDIKKLQNQYKTVEMLVNQNQKIAFDKANPKGLTPATGSPAGTSGPAATTTTPAAGTTTPTPQTRKKRALMGAKKKLKMRK